MTESELIDRYLSGEEQAGEELIVRYRKCIYNLAFRMTWDPEDAMDLTQNTFVQMIRNLRSFRRESSFKTWLYRIAFNNCLNHKARRRFTEECAGDTVACNDEGTLSRLLKKEQEMSLKRAIASLSGRQRMVILLRTYEGLSCREVGEIMNITEGAVKAHYHNGVKALRSLLGAREHETRT